MVVLLLDVAGCGKQRPSGGLSKLKPCRLAGIDEELLCGKLTVFENRETRTGRTIDLNIVVLPAFDQNTKAEPLFDLAGGPGASSVERSRILRRTGQRVPPPSRCGVRRSARHRRIKSPRNFAGENSELLPERDVSSRLRQENASRARATRGPDEIHNVHRDG